jgi:hypothetical protein
VLSESSIASHWVATEILHSRSREGCTGERVLFPIRLAPFELIRQWTLFDPDSGTDLARTVRSFYIPDFSNWHNESSFEQAFERLLDDLKVGELGNGLIC